MILISHRGNIDRPIKELENTEEYIKKALEKGYEVEIDLWKIEEGIFLGHDYPQHKTSFEFIITPKLWIHCKNIEALEYCKDFKVANNYFFHNTDDATITSKGFFWTYPGKILTKYSIAVLPEVKPYSKNIQKCAGICSDYIDRF